jgi:hypothetical protein
LEFLVNDNLLRFGCRLAWETFTVKFEATIIYQAGDHGLRGMDGKGLAIGQPIAHIDLQMAAEERRASVFRGSHAPFPKTSPDFPYAFLDLTNDFFVIDLHDCSSLRYALADKTRHLTPRR